MLRKSSGAKCHFVRSVAQRSSPAERLSSITGLNATARKTKRWANAPQRRVWTHRAANRIAARLCVTG
jgi:hypothetical protein